MFRPRPGSVVPLYDTDLVVKKMSAKSSRAPNTLAHQASEVPQPSQVPYDVPGLTAIVASARAVPVPRTPPSTAPPAAASRALRPRGEAGCAVADFGCCSGSEAVMSSPGAGAGGGRRGEVLGGLRGVVPRKHRV